MASIGNTGSRPTSSPSSSPQVKAEPKLAEKPATQSQAKAQPAENAVKAAVAERYQDGFDAAPRKASASQPKIGEIGSHTHGPGDTHGAEDSAAPSSTAAAAGSGPVVTTEASGRTVVDLGSGSNNATVSQATDGGLKVTSDGKVVTLTAEQSRNAVIRGGAGNDNILVDASVTSGISIEGGDGDDRLVGGEGDDRLMGGAGNDVIIGGNGKDWVWGDGGDDYLEGGAGDDTMDGGDGRDVMYGLDGNDSLSGGGSRDYIDGGAGDDTASGGDGDDQVIGGRGNDTLNGDLGNDAVAGGLGKDVVQGGDGSDKLYVQDEDDAGDVAAGDTKQLVDMTDSDTLGSSISITGNANFRARVESDLDAIRSMPIGHELLKGMDASGKKTTIQETSAGNSAGGTKFSDGFMTADGKPGPGTDSQVNYNTTRTSLGNEDWMTRPPVVGFFHELVHAYDMVNGTLAPGQTDGTRNLENAAVGLPIDHDGDASTPKITQNRPAENHLREELNLPRRPRY
ncbi:MAG TPA: M91 family zinc metallopeptidase [Hyalangium sp.]|nr:M91 family zinc metallopeptidase [Hyalangium sp.]